MLCFVNSVATVRPLPLELVTDRNCSSYLAPSPGRKGHALVAFSPAEDGPAWVPNRLPESTSCGLRGKRESTCCPTHAYGHTFRGASHVPNSD